VDEDMPAVNSNTSSGILVEGILTSEVQLSNDSTSISSLVVRQLGLSRRYHCPACSYQALLPIRLIFFMDSDSKF
jgi:hypothetical protein